MDTPLSNGDIAKMLNINVSDIIPYANLSLYKSILDLLPNPYSFKIILLQESIGKGHWTCLLRQKNKYYYFNSYGEKYDIDLNSISRLARKILGQDEPKIQNLLGGRKMDYNKIKFQNGTSNTCGRYVVYMVQKCIYDKIPFNKIIKNLQRESASTTPDEYILKVI
jgi:hypothetical protein